MLYSFTHMTTVGVKG